MMNEGPALENRVERRDAVAPSYLESMFRSVMMFMFFITAVQLLFSPKKSTTHTTNESKSHISVFQATNNLPIVDIVVILSKNSTLSKAIPKSKITWRINNILLDWSHSASNYSHFLNYSTSNVTQPIFAHVYVLASDLSSKWPLFQTFPDNKIILQQCTFPLVVTKEVKVKPAVRNLLSSSNEASSVTSNHQTSVNATLMNISYWKPSLDINIVLDFPNFPYDRIPVDVADRVNFTREGYFLPVLYYNDFWLTSKKYMEMNSTSIESLPLQISYHHIAFWKWQVQNTMEQSWKQQSVHGLGGSDSETDMIREMLTETSPWLLGLTLVVTLFHSLFDVLAFKNDIQFWQGKKDMKGMSVQSLAINCISQTFILLYLFDNDTSMLILFSSTIGIVIEYWKLSKTLKFDMKKWTWAYVNSYNEDSTQVYDKEAITHMTYIVVPAIFGYSIYSLIYKQFKSYYSWLLSTIVSFIYLFGFALMVPQLYINYKLKSVAHMSWKAMVYKSLNTFIDDLFSFIIKMPTLHRLACFRDDIIFFIYLYQKWIYRVDYSRTNEYGQGQEQDIAAVSEATDDTTTHDNQ